MGWFQIPIIGRLVVLNLPHLQEFPGLRIGNPRVAIGLVDICEHSNFMYNNYKVKRGDEVVFDRVCSI